MKDKRKNRIPKEPDLKPRCEVCGILLVDRRMASVEREYKRCRKHVPPEAFCQGLTRDREKCPNLVMPGKLYCGVHEGLAAENIKTRCKAKVNSGKRCLGIAVDGMEFCNRHRNAKIIWIEGLDFPDSMTDEECYNILYPEDLEESGKEELPPIIEVYKAPKIPAPIALVSFPIGKVLSPKYYEAYINSDLWREKARMARDAAGGKCQVCNGNGSALQVHHRTYERLGVERLSDLIVLCKDCHDLFHANKRIASPHDGQHIPRK